MAAVVVYDRFLLCHSLSERMVVWHLHHINSRVAAVLADFSATISCRKDHSVFYNPNKACKSIRHNFPMNGVCTNVPMHPIAMPPMLAFHCRSITLTRGIKNLHFRLAKILYNFDSTFKYRQYNQDDWAPPIQFDVIIFLVCFDFVILFWFIEWHVQDYFDKRNSIFF